MLACSGALRAGGVFGCAFAVCGPDCASQRAVFQRRASVMRHRSWPDGCAELGRSRKFVPLHVSGKSIAAEARPALVKVQAVLADEFVDRIQRRELI